MNKTIVKMWSLINDELLAFKIYVMDIELKLDIFVDKMQNPRRSVFLMRKDITPESTPHDTSSTPESIQIEKYMNMKQINRS